MSDLISRQAAIDATERLTKDCNPEHFVGHPNFIEYMESAEIGSFGNWQFANGFNLGLTAAEVAIENLPSAQPEIIRCKDCEDYQTDWETSYPNEHYCATMDRMMPEDGFCSNAERREVKDERV